jgi:hypothetical protein
MWRSKKSSLNISINAIVIIVLAMTFLGLGLGFVRNMFGGVSDMTVSVQEQIKQQILDDLRTGDKKLSFPTTQVKVGSKEETIISIGVKNTGDQDLNFELVINQGDLEANPVTNPDDSMVDGAFFWDSTTQILEPGEANVYGIKFFAPTTKTTYLYKLTVYDTIDMSEYTSKSFFIRVI